jgi:Ser/Thr protein kinase RdoA (MazF antagonist)
VLAAVRRLPRDVAEYGLIHQDAHAANFFVDDTGAITLFDFDDCAYGWFAYDVALVVFYAVTGLRDPRELATWFIPAFFAGYGSEADLPAQQIGWIPLFMRLREIDTYGVIHRDDDADTSHPWTRAFLDGRRQRIEAAAPVVEFDWTVVA